MSDLVQELLDKDEQITVLKENRDRALATVVDLQKKLEKCQNAKRPFSPAASDAVIAAQVKRIEQLEIKCRDLIFATLQTPITTYADNI